jgi:hypothetical protein
MIDVKELFHGDKKTHSREFTLKGRSVGGSCSMKKGRRVRGIDRSIERLAYHYNVRKGAE